MKGANEATKHSSLIKVCARLGNILTSPQPHFGNERASHGAWDGDQYGCHRILVVHPVVVPISRDIYHGYWTLILHVSKQKSTCLHMLDGLFGHAPI